MPSKKKSGLKTEALADYKRKAAVLSEFVDGMKTAAKRGPASKKKKAEITRLYNQLLKTQQEFAPYGKLVPVPKKYREIYKSKGAMPNKNLNAIPVNGFGESARIYFRADGDLTISANSRTWRHEIVAPPSVEGIIEAAREVFRNHRRKKGLRVRLLDQKLSPFYAESATRSFKVFERGFRRFTSIYADWQNFIIGITWNLEGA